MNLPLHCVGLVVGVGTKSKGNSNAGWFMSESGTVGLGLWELRAREGVIRGR